MPYRTPQDRLGELERVHRSPFPARAILLFCLVFGLPGLALLSGFQSAPGELFSGDRVTNSAIGVLLLGAALTFSVLLLRKATLTVAVHANGLRWRERGRTEDIPWDKISEVKAVETRRTSGGIHVATTKVYRVIVDDGRVRIATNMLDGIDALGARLLAKAPTSPSS